MKQTRGFSISSWHVYAILIFFFALVTPLTVSGQSSAPIRIDTGAELIIKLVTVEPGEEVYAWWGHTGVVVENRRTGTSRFYDYGLFSFRQENFYTNFAQGRLLYEVGVWPTQSYLEHYRNLNRTVHIQTLSIPVEKRAALAKALEVSALPENRIYLYDHYYDNCATRPRDIIDEYVDGALREATKHGSGITYREITRNYTQHVFFMDLLLMYLMSDVIDIEMSVWETMFLPDMLESGLGSVRIPAGEAGRLVPLVSHTEVFNKSQGRRIIPETAPPLLPKALFLGLGIGLFCLVGGILSLRFPRTGSISLGITIAIIGFASGLFGSLLFFLSLFTDHVVTYGNENIIFTNPLSFALLVSGILMARRSKRHIEITGIVTAVFASAVGVLALLKLVISTLDQQNWPDLALFGSIYALLFITCAILYVGKVRSIRLDTSQT